MSRDTYLHITEFGDLELCHSDLLCQNIFNGSLLVPHLLSIKNAYSIIDKAIIKFSVRYLIISSDPFYLHTKHISYFASLSIPVGLILSDTHHGIFPLSRSIQFCIDAKVQSVLLRFNQRHAAIFKKFGIWADSTVFSPDIARYIRDEMPESSHSSKSTNDCLDHSKVDPTILSHLFQEQTGTFVGRPSSTHPFRYIQLQKLLKQGYKVEIISTNGPREMMRKLRTSYWALNLPLNGDFNRRFVEIILAGIPMISEYIPQSQMIYPFSTILDHVCFAKFGACAAGENSPEIRFLATHKQTQPRSAIAARSFLLKLFHSGFDNRILESFCHTLTKKNIVYKYNASKDLFQAIKLYDIFLDAHKNPIPSSQRTIRMLEEKHAFLAKTINIDAFDEFYRLTEVLRTM